MPLALLEAMASGLPGAATDVGDISEIVAPENSGLIKGCRSKEALSQNLAYLASRPMLRTQLGDRNKARARKEFSQAAMIQKYRDLFFALSEDNRFTPAEEKTTRAPPLLPVA